MSEASNPDLSALVNSGFLSSSRRMLGKRKDITIPHQTLLYLFLGSYLAAARNFKSINMVHSEHTMTRMSEVDKDLVPMSLSASSSESFYSSFGDDCISRRLDGCSQHRELTGDTPSDFRSGSSGEYFKS